MNNKNQHILGYEHHSECAQEMPHRGSIFDGATKVWIGGELIWESPKLSYGDLQARIKELEAQLEAIGAGGVSGQRIT